MSMNLKKSKILCIKGSATIALPNYSFETTEVMKDLGILITNRHALLDATRKKEGSKSLKRALRTQRDSLKGKFRDQKKRITFVTLCHLCATVQLSRIHQKVA